MSGGAEVPLSFVCEYWTYGDWLVDQGRNDSVGSDRIR